MSVFKDKAGEL